MSAYRERTRRELELLYREAKHSYRGRVAGTTDPTTKAVREVAMLLGKTCQGENASLYLLEHHSFIPGDSK